MADHYSDSEEEIEDVDLQLGFAVPPPDDEPGIFEEPDWRKWDGGQIGGKPYWLDPKELPAPVSKCPRRHPKRKMYTT